MGSLDSFLEHGYLVKAPHVSLDIPEIGEMSGTSLRQALGSADPETFQNIMGWFDEDTYNMLKGKFSNTMNEMIFHLIEEVFEEKKREPEQELSEIAGSSMAGGSAEGGAAGAFSGVDVKEENEKQEKNSHIPNKDDIVDEVVDYLLGKMENL